MGGYFNSIKLGALLSQIATNYMSRQINELRAREANEGLDTFLQGAGGLVLVLRRVSYPEAGCPGAFPELAEEFARVLCELTRDATNSRVKPAGPSKMLSPVSRRVYHPSHCGRECIASRVRRHKTPPNPGHPFSGGLMRHENQTRATRQFDTSAFGTPWITYDESAGIWSMTIHLPSQAVAPDTDTPVSYVCIGVK
jgi:hypothetical protein